MSRIVFLPFVCVLLVAVGCGPKPTEPAPVQPAKPTDSAPPTEAAKPTTRATTPATTPATNPTPPKAAGATLRGAVTHPGKKGQKLSVGYVELAGSEWVGDVVGHTLPAADEPASVESDPFPPRKAKLSFDKTVTFEFTSLPAGTYFVFAKMDDAAAVWAKVDVKADATVTHDLKLEAGKGGGVEVKTPADYEGEVRLAPNDLIPAEDTSFVGVKIATQLEFGGKVKDGKVTIADVPPGKYTLFAFPGKGPVTARGTVDVTVGKTATVELAAEKK
jgi:hypothetical protein